MLSSQGPARLVEDDSGFPDVPDEYVGVNERKARIPILPDSFCFMFFGKRGSGKSAAMAKFGKDEAMMGKKVWYWPPDFSFKYGQPIQALELYSLPPWLKNGVVLIDEIQVLMNRMRTVSTANQFGGAMLQQLRKRGLNIYGTSNQPGRIDNTVALQTNIHYECEKVEDRRCKERGYHGSDCTDHIILRFTDTNGDMGYDHRWKDGRKRGISVLWRIRDVYSIYNTQAIADMTEVIGITKDAVLGAKEDAKAGMSTEAIKKALWSEWIPWLVGQGRTTLTPGAFAMAVNEQEGLNISAVQMGRALNELGLGSTVASNGRRTLRLPPADKLADWRNGTWSPD